MPFLYKWRLRYATTGGSNSARYCYSVWLRHLVTLNAYGFKVEGGRVAELGPGDSLGVGLAALLSGAARYVGLDIGPFASRLDHGEMFRELVTLYSRKEPIPDNGEFPEVRPLLGSQAFPDYLIDLTDFAVRTRNIEAEIRRNMSNGRYVNYYAPWTASGVIAEGSLDLIVSQAVLEHVDELEEAYRIMFLWLRSGGYASHAIDFGCHHLAPSWNGHWMYPDWEWRLVRGRRDCLINREPLSTHIRFAKQAGFEILAVNREYDDRGVQCHALCGQFTALDPNDVRTRGAHLILRKTRGNADFS
jgi:hypothetical protein